MEVHVGEMNTTVRAADSQALLSPAVLEQITVTVMARLKAETERQRRIDDERRLVPQLPSVRDLPWEQR